jgi:Holliday junction resolvase RusA-like endonuclease/uncharacterized CHY-type Zn-finger protein
MEGYAKIIIKGSPITKSNFKLSNLNGRAILPNSSGKYHDRYAVYEEQIAYEARSQNPDVCFSESLIAILHVYYKSSKRHPDTINITKSIFDGIEKSGMIINDAQIRRLIIEEFYDKENPRFELELYAESKFSLKYEVTQNEVETCQTLYDLPSNKKRLKSPISSARKAKDEVASCSKGMICEVCKKAVSTSNYISGNNGKTIICKECFKKMF